MAFRLGELVLLILGPDKHEQYQPGIWEMGIADSIGAALTTAGPRGGKSDLPQPPGLADYRMPIGTSLNLQLQRTKIVAVESQGFPPTLEGLDQDESRSILVHHHRATSGAIADRNTTYDE